MPPAFLRNRKHAPLCVTARDDAARAASRCLMGLGRVEGSGFSHLQSSPDLTSSTVSSPAPAVADRRVQSRFLSRGSQGGETTSHCLAHPAGDCPRLWFCQLGAIDLIG